MTVPPSVGWKAARTRTLESVRYVAFPGCGFAELSSPGLCLARWAARHRSGLHLGVTLFQRPGLFSARAAIWLGNPPFIVQKISRSGSLRSRAGHRAKQPRPGQILSASLRLCVEIDALKTPRRKDAKSQRIQPTCARRPTQNRPMTKSAPRAFGLEHSADRTPRHSVERLVR